MNIYENSDKRVPIKEDNPSIKRDYSKCILCGACKSVCKFSQGVYGNYEIGNTKEPICINCGQCLLVCPTNSITEVKDVFKVKQKIKDGYVVIFQTAPSVRVALGEKFGLEEGRFVEGKMISALKLLGASYVFDTTFGADLTIMEETAEIIKRLKNNENLPQFTSCCPAWVKFVEIFHPHLIPNLSTTRSPILMQGAIIKTYFAKKIGLDPTKIINVAVAPCTAKKYEITRKQFSAVSDYYADDSLKDMDYIITTNELADWIIDENIDFNSLVDGKFDDLCGSGAGYIFGNSGGVMEAAMRNAYYVLTGEDPKENLLNFKEVRGVDGIKEATLNIGNKNLNLAIISGTNNVNRMLKKIEDDNLKYDFIEVMACPGGCIAGGGQPKTIPITNTLKQKRMEGLYKKDEHSKDRISYKNKNIEEIYDEFLGDVLSTEAKKLLHTYYEDKSDLLNIGQVN